MRIIAYTWQADTHCPACTKRAANAGYNRKKTHRLDKRRRTEYDEHGVHDGFDAHPVFTTDETSAQLPVQDGGCDLACGTCRMVITPHYDNT